MEKLSIVEMISISYEWGGIEQHVKDLTRCLVSNGNKVSVVCRDVPLHVQMYSEESTVYRLPIRNAVDIATIRGLSKIIKNDKVHIIHTHTSRDAWIALFATWFAGRGKVITTRHVPFKAKQDAFHTWYYNQLAGIICVSKFVYNKFLGEKPKINTQNVHVIYPGIKIKNDRVVMKRIVRETLKISDDMFLIGFVGRITVEKGLNDLLQATAILKKTQEKFRVVIVGDVNPVTPEYLDTLKQQIQDLGIQEYIHFYGFTKDVVSVMDDIDVLVLPSIIPETFGLVLCEAMLAGKPVVTTNTGAQVEIVEDGVTGFSVPAFSPEKMAEKLEVFITNPQRAAEFGQKAKDSIYERFDENRMARDVEIFFNECAHKE